MTTLTTGGATYSSVYKIADSGDVAGYVGSSGGSYPVIWDAANNLTFISSVREGQTLAVNSSRVAAGFLDRFNSTGFVWSEAGGVQLLPALPGYARSYPYAINNSSVIVGSSDLNNGSGSSQAFLWTGSNGIQDLGPGAAVDINDYNVVVGQSGGIGFVWDDALGRRDLNALGDFASWNLTQAIGINDQGQIVGRGQYQSLPAAFLLTPVPEPSGVASVIAGIGFGCWHLRRRVAA